MEPVIDDDFGRREYLLAYSVLLAGVLSAFSPEVRKTNTYQRAIALLEGPGGTPAGAKDSELLLEALAASPACQSNELQVLDLGAGTGGDFVFLLENLAIKRVKILAVEPNIYYWPAAQVEAGQIGLYVDAPRSVPASSGFSRSSVSLFEDTSLIPENSVNLVLAKRVLCSVDDAEAVVREIFRVLRPGGVFFFIEHVAAEEGSPLRLFQEVYRPVQQAYAAGCDPARDTAATIRKASPWDQVFVENFDLQGYGPITTNIRGFARKPS